MEFRLLGFVTIQKDKTRVRPSSAGARTLIASLAWQPDDFISDETLIDRIWGEYLPEDPRDALYTAAKRMRRAIKEIGGDDCLRRRRGGYVLTVDPESIDLHRFRRLVRQAQLADDDGAAARAYELAEHLWAGTPLSDVDCAWAVRAREALNRERIMARIDGIEVGMRQGRYREMISVLSGLAMENPLDEQIAGLLMTALHHTGRRTEAIRCYTRIRDELIEHLGMEPGAALRALLARVLQDQPPG